eukprot:CAMPEP_0173086344 /NCGR_PEP_ID=MMETSP1102-20130122/22685_1 /TAXON_ID=49646 /ORGANISM="Geminigera sp., Strain Caron Lab Isolate" /LENGTH=67 /DNA_ID=CAMNT_0013966843 /DNA_START=234 /DNA_END=434 /DNA_ORIENTATION=+
MTRVLLIFICMFDQQHACHPSSAGAHGGVFSSHSRAGGAAGASGSAGGVAACAPAPRTPEAAAAPGD